MEFLSAINTIFYVLLQFLIYFPTGFLLLDGKIKSAPFIVKFPIFVSFGLIITTIIVSAIGVIYIGNGVLPVLVIISYGILIFKLYRSKLDYRICNFKKSLKNFGIPHIASLLLFMFVISHFSWVVAYLKWPPGLDAIYHGFYTSVLVHNHRLQANLAPIAPSQSLFEPFGLHVMAAQLSFLFGIFPGEALLILVTAIIISILLLLYSLVYILTKSTAFSTVALLSGFYIYPIVTDIRFLEKWLIGYYYNTPYSNLFGYLPLLEFIAFVFVIFDENQKTTIFKLSILLTLAAIAITYTPFITLPIIYIFSAYIIKRYHNFKDAFYPIRQLFLYLRSSQKLRNNNLTDYMFYSTARRNVFVKTNLITIMIIGILSIFSIAFMMNFGTILQTDLFKLLHRVQSNSYYYSGIVLRPDFFVNFTGIWTLLSSGLAIVSIVKRNRVNFSVFYLLFSVIIIVSTIFGKVVNDYIWALFPGRLFAFLIIFDWIMLITYISDFVGWFVNNKLWPKNIGKKYHNDEHILQISRALISLVVIFMFFLPSVVSHITFEQANQWGWIVATPHFRNDYDLFRWVSLNTNISDLIMTDYTYTSRSIQSFSLKNVTATPFPHSPAEIERAKDNVIAWDRPTLLRSFINRYDVKYILLDSEWGHRIPPEIGGNDQYTYRIFTADQYREIFSHMPFLKVVKQVGSSALYKVIEQR
jgi:hypothetical protein